ncbi:MAG: aminotransferase class IV [bacterium]|nr:aminotransferase class IV [bacterium]
MKSEILFFNGKRIDGEKLNFYDLRRGFLYGDGIFETLIYVNKKVFRFEQHWKRLKKGAQICNLKVPEREEIKKLILDILKEFENKSYYIRINLWRKNPPTFSPKDERESNYLIIIREFEPYLEKFYEEGIKCAVSKKVRRNEKSIISRVKSLNFLENIIMKIETEENKVDDVIVLNTSNYISEGSVSNIFFVKEDRVYTPSLECGCLDGITRKVVFEICEKEKIKIEEGFFKLEFLKEVDEIFFTNTLMGILPVKEINGYFKMKKLNIVQYLRERYLEELNI